MPCREHVVQLHRNLEAFKARQAEIILVSFTGGYWAEAWQSEMGVPFPMIIDEDKDLYREYGLHASLWGGVGAKITAYYVRRFFSTGKLPSVRGNPIQLGGDFIIDGAGQLAYAYRSVDATDRPSVDDLLAELEALAL